VFAYTGAVLVAVGQGDTLVSLAARFLGDARLWQHIAVLNGLKPPFVTEQATQDLLSTESPFPGAIGVGSRILVPTFARPPSQFPVLPVLGVKAEEGAEVQFLGSDLALEIVGGRAGAFLYDIAVDVEGGSVDAKVVSGIQNMVQALTTRIDTEQGTDLLYKRVGVGPVIGTNMLVADLESARAKISEAILADPRVASVRRLDFTGTDKNALIVDGDAELRGFTEAASIRAVV
jgi:hypothetical protein